MSMGLIHRVCMQTKDQKQINENKLSMAALQEAFDELKHDVSALIPGPSACAARSIQVCAPSTARPAKFDRDGTA